MSIANIMTRTLVVVSPDESLRNALTLLEQQDIRHLPVVSDGELVGMLSDRDVREYKLPLMEEIDDPEYADELLDRPVSDVMNSFVISVDSGEEPKAAVETMLEYGVGAVPVVDRHTEELVGIVSYVDILRLVRNTL